ncbi:PTS sugar transporter subunit IIA [Elusimicrobiota bacterium]
MVNFIVITHGEFGAYLVEAAERIVGPQGGGVLCVGISARLSMDDVSGRLAEAVDRLDTGEGLVIVTDMPGGTPSNVALRLVKELPLVHVVSGVNLYMLVTAFNFRRTLSARELVEKMLEAGRRAVADVKSILATRA